MENKAHALVAGLFLLVLGAAMIAVTLWFEGDRAERMQAWVVTTSEVPGLAAKALVKLRGVQIGSVESIAFDRHDARRIVVRIAVDPAEPLTRGTFAQLSYQGITGLTFIDLADRGDDPRPLSALPEAERRIELKPSVLDRLATGAPELLTAFSETAQRLNAVLAPQNRERMERLLDRADATLGELEARAMELRPAVAALRPLADEFVRSSRQARRAVEGLYETSERFGRLATELQDRLPLVDRLGEAGLRLGATAQSIGRGLVGDQTPSTPLVQSLGQAADAIDRAALQWADQPQSVIFGRSPPPPGPGEPGFVASFPRR